MSNESCNLPADELILGSRDASSGGGDMDFLSNPLPLRTPLPEHVANESNEGQAVESRCGFSFGSASCTSLNSLTPRTDLLFLLTRERVRRRTCIGGGVGDGGLRYLGFGYQTWVLEIVRTRGGPFRR
jgi:hypothetical protein